MIMFMELSTFFPDFNLWFSGFMAETPDCGKMLANW
jgi:hypothetical protein